MYKNCAGGDTSERRSPRMLQLSSATESGRLEKHASSKLMKKIFSFNLVRSPKYKKEWSWDNSKFVNKIAEIIVLLILSFFTSSMKGQE